MGARVRDLREAPQLPAARGVSRHTAHSRGRRVAAACLRRPAHVHLHGSSRLAVQRRHRGHGRIVRAVSPELASPAAPYLREVASWRAHGRTLTVHLRRVAPDFEQRLALPYFCAVPVDTPNVQSDHLPSAGPFAIAHYTHGRSVLLARHRFYHGP